MKNQLFTYDNVYLRPKYSKLTSRANADTSINFLGQKFRIPVIPANMQDVISWKIAHELSLNKYAYIMHRFNGETKEVLTSMATFRSTSVGVNESSTEELKYICENGGIPEWITIDVAHGQHLKVEHMVGWLRGFYSSVPVPPKIIAGNVATAEGYKFLCDLGVDAVKVGIGGGSICSTRYKTGFHLPTAYSIYECAQLGLNVPIIADGGATHFGDISKALVLGADMVMSGRWFAECIDSPAKIQNGKKIYRGSTSFESKGHNNHVEGHTIELSQGITYPERLLEIEQALQSAISYAGGTDLSAFNNVEWDLF
jgi:GMP reductase